MADLLGSILSSMDKPPTQSEQERKAAKGTPHDLLLTNMLVTLSNASDLSFIQIMTGLLCHVMHV